MRVGVVEFRVRGRGQRSTYLPICLTQGGRQGRQGYIAARIERGRATICCTGVRVCSFAFLTSTSGNLLKRGALSLSETFKLNFLDTSQSYTFVNTRSTYHSIESILTVELPYHITYLIHTRKII